LGFADGGNTNDGLGVGHGYFGGGVGFSLAWGIGGCMGGECGMILPILSSISSEQCLGKGTVLLLYVHALSKDSSALLLYRTTILMYGSALLL
jgi:hypothetical protein